MAPVLYQVYSSPLPGRDDDFHRWNDEVHQPQMLQVPGIESARRYEIPQPSPMFGECRFVTVYELVGDPASILAEVGARLADGRMTRPDAVDTATMRAIICQPRTPS